jgi:hypothetical protein
LNQLKGAFLAVNEFQYDAVPEIGTRISIPRVKDISISKLQLMPVRPRSTKRISRTPRSTRISCQHNTGIVRPQRATRGKSLTTLKRSRKVGHHRGQILKRDCRTENRNIENLPFSRRAHRATIKKVVANKDGKEQMQPSEEHQTPKPAPLVHQHSTIEDLALKLPTYTKGGMFNDATYSAAETWLENHEANNSPPSATLGLETGSEVTVYFYGISR